MESPQSKTSLTLMRRLRADPQDVEVWNEFLITYGPRIDAWCRRWKLQEADVEDVTQTVLLKLSRQFGRFQYDSTQSFRGWLRTVTESALSDFVAARKKHKAVNDVADILYSIESRQDLLEGLSEAFDLELLAEARSHVQGIIDPLHWTTFTLMADESLSAAEVSAQTGVSIPNAFKIKSRVQIQIRDEIASLDMGRSP